MSMELYVLSDRRLASIAAWQQVLDRRNSDLKLPAYARPESMQGFLPVQLRGEKGGFECRHEDTAELMRTYPEVAFGQAWRHTLAFRWGASLLECLCAWTAATAYASATGGIVFDPEQGEILNVRQAGDRILEMQAAMPVVQAALQRMTEQARKTG